MVDESTGNAWSGRGPRTTVPSVGVRTIRSLLLLFVVVGAVVAGAAAASGRAASSGAAQQTPTTSPSTTTSAPVAEMPVSAPAPSPAVGRQGTAGHRHRRRCPLHRRNSLDQWWSPRDGCSPAHAPGAVTAARERAVGVGIELFQIRAQVGAPDGRYLRAGSGWRSRHWSLHKPSPVT